MTILDPVIYKSDSLSNGSTVPIQPSGTEVDKIMTISYTGSIEVYLDADSSYPIIAATGAAGILINLNLLVSNTDYLTIKNVSGGTIKTKARGVVVKA
jgi:hypothetical protein